MEHHSNIVPWQILCEEKGAVLKVIPMNDAGELLVEEFEKLLSPKTKLVSIVYVSNSLGTINPVKHIIDKAHAVGAVVMLDAAQAMAHETIDVQKLNCDFLAASAHKFFGPTGIGFLYGKMNLLEAMPPYQGGGDMISSVSFEKTTYNEVPYKFEAGTPHIEGVIAMGAAVDYLSTLDVDAVKKHEHHLVELTSSELQKIKGIRLIGTAKEKASVVSFIVEGVNSMDVGQLLDTMGIAVRTGQHCTEPIMQRLGIQGTIRASFSIYNTEADVKALIEGVKKSVSILI
jgi:cysteine desulfurase/selenocysteine lyase